MIKYIGFYVYHRSYLVLTMAPRNRRRYRTRMGVLFDHFAVKSCRIRSQYSSSCRGSKVCPKKQPTRYEYQVCMSHAGGI